MSGRQAGAAVLGLALGAAFMGTWAEAALVALGCTALVGLSPAVHPRALRARLRPFGYFAALTLLFGGIGSGEPLFFLGPLVWSAEALERAALAAVRLLFFGALATWVTLAVGTATLLGSLWRAGAALRRLGVDATPVLVGLAVAVRFLPLLQQEAGRLRLAWRARSAGLFGRGPLAEVRSLLGLVVPILAAALRRAESFAAAVELRAAAAGGGAEASGGEDRAGVAGGGRGGESGDLAALANAYAPAAQTAASRRPEGAANRRARTRVGEGRRAALAAALSLRDAAVVALGWLPLLVRLVRWGV